jgi:hypothetical protein
VQRGFSLPVISRILAAMASASFARPAERVPLPEESGDDLGTMTTSTFCKEEFANLPAHFKLSKSNSASSSQTL